MNDRASGFRIGRDDDVAEFFDSPRTGGEAQATRLDVRRLAKISRRVTLLALLLPILLGAVILAVYVDLNKRMDEAAGEDAAEALQATAENLKKELEKQMSEMGGRYEKLEAALSDKDQAMNEAFLVFEKTSASLKEDIGEFQSAIQSLSDSKAGNDRLEALRKEFADRADGLKTEIGRLETAVETAGDEAKALTDEMKIFQEHSRAEMDSISQLVSESTARNDTLNADLENTRKEMVEVLSTTIDRKALDLTLGRQKAELRKEIDFLSKKLGDKDKTIRRLERRVGQLESSVKRLSARPMGTPKPGDILEQDIE